MDNRYLSVDIGKITVSVKMDDEGICLDVIKKSNPIGFSPIEEEVVETAWKTYSEFGFEVKELEIEEWIGKKTEKSIFHLENLSHQTRYKEKF